MTESYPGATAPGQSPQVAPGLQDIPPQPVAAYAGPGAPQALPPGMYFDPNSGLVLPEGVQLASVGRRIGAYFLSIVLSIVTLGIGYFIWGLIAWGSGRSPALQVLGMRCWSPANGRKASWGTMALRDIIGGIVQSILGVTALVSFILFLTGNQHKSIPDHIGGTVVVYDPNKVLDNWQR